MISRFSYLMFDSHAVFALMEKRLLLLMGRNVGQNFALVILYKLDNRPQYYAKIDKCLR